MIFNIVLKNLSAIFKLFPTYLNKGPQTTDAQINTCIHHKSKITEVLFTTGWKHENNSLKLFFKEKNLNKAR